MPTRILIVDDNEVNRVVAGEILRSAGYQTAEAANGVQALDALRGGHRPLGEPPPPRVGAAAVPCAPPSGLTVKHTLSACDHMKCEVAPSRPPKRSASAS